MFLVGLPTFALETDVTVLVPLGLIRGGSTEPGGVIGHLSKGGGATRKSLEGDILLLFGVQGTSAVDADD